MAPTTTYTRSHYDVLGIDPTADDVEVRRAWKILVQVWHPDRFSGEMREEAEQTTSRINEAYHALREPARRGAYDRRLAAERATAEPVAPRNPFASPSPSATQRMGGSTWGGVATARPMAAPPRQAPEPGRIASDIVGELVRTAGRYPRLLGGVAVLWVVVFGGAFLSDLAARPKLPSFEQAVTRDMTAADSRWELPATSHDSAGDIARDERAAQLASRLPEGPPAPAPSSIAGAADLPSDAELGIDPGAGGPAGPQAAPDGWEQPAAADRPRGRVVRVMPKQPAPR